MIKREKFLIRVCAEACYCGEVFKEEESSGSEGVIYF